MKRSLFLLLSAVVVGSVLLAACGPAATPTAAPTGAPTTAATEAPTAAGTEAPTSAPGGKSITIALQQEPDLVSSLFSAMSYASWITQMTNVGLGRWNDKGELEPLLATEIPSADNGGVSADGLTITWKLKPDLKWSDGEPLTSADVKFTYEALIDPGNAPYSNAGYTSLDSVETPDAQTAILHFKELYPGWQTMFSQGPNNQGEILPEHILKGKTALQSDPEIHQPTVFSGPWMISEWVAGDHMTLVPNPNYAGNKPKLDQINLKFVPDSNTALSALQTGDVDLVPDFSESDIETIEGLEPAVHLRVDAGPEFEHYLFNLGSAAGVTQADGTVVGKADQDGPCVFKDVNVRKAIILGIDRQTIVDTLLAGKTTVPAGLWPNSYWTNTALQPYPYDPDQANQLLDAAGYTDTDGDGIRDGTCDGNPVKLSFTFETTNKPLRQDMGTAVQDQLAQIGVEFKPTYLEAGSFFGSYTEGANMAKGLDDMDGYTTGFYPDPYTDNFLCSAVTSADNPGGSNWYHFCDPALDDLFAQANASADPAARKPIFDQIQQYMYDNALMIPFYARANVYGSTDRLDYGETSVVSGWSWDTEDWDVK